MAIPKLRPTKVAEFIIKCFRVKRVPYVAGPPGIGKSAVFHQVADNLNLKLIDMRLSQKLSEDLTGLPERDEKTGKAYYLPFNDIPMAGDPLPDGYAGWLLLLDELSSAPEEILAAAYSLLWDHRVGGHEIHHRCLIAGAGNRSEDSAIARPLPDTIIRRMLPCEMKPSHEDWLDHARNSNFCPDVIDYIKNNAGALHTPIDKENRVELEPYACPSAWEAVSDHMLLFQKDNRATAVVKTDSAGIPMPASDSDGRDILIDGVTQHLIDASVGKIAGRAFSEHYNSQLALPYVWEVAQSPNSTPIPTSSANKVKLIEQLVEYYLESQDQTREGILSYVNRVGQEHAELFYTIIGGKLGTTNTDIALRRKLAQRLAINLENPDDNPNTNGDRRVRRVPL